MPRNLMKQDQKFAVILLKLPDGRVILQRRTKDASNGAGLLGLFGGWVEEGETPSECIIRELREETSLNPDSLTIYPIGDIIVPASKSFDKDRHFYLYVTWVDNAEFKVYEGDGAELLTPSELLNRNDVIVSTRYIFEHARIN